MIGMVWFVYLLMRIILPYFGMGNLKSAVRILEEAFFSIAFYSTLV